MVLHTVNKTGETLQRCLEVATKGDAMLLIEDGVYAAQDNEVNKMLWHGQQDRYILYALDCDLAARGLSAKMLPFFEHADWKVFVELTIEHDKVISWG